MVWGFHMRNPQWRRRSAIGKRALDDMHVITFNDLQGHSSKLHFVDKESSMIPAAMAGGGGGGGAGACGGVGARGADGGAGMDHWDREQECSEELKILAFQAKIWWDCWVVWNSPQRLSSMEKFVSELNNVIDINMGMTGSASKKQNQHNNYKHPRTPYFHGSLSSN
ncbi:conserved hypothetical protein [Ricinus communis]|uniref:Uncharacterized protein n=1 Tax=Ricinus communis TaxID=3988 RepID=B9S7J5_RICCO|nr:conserved hypothetical protein [Ricinus communis]